MSGNPRIARNATGTGSRRRIMSRGAVYGVDVTSPHMANGTSVKSENNCVKTASCPSKTERVHAGICIEKFLSTEASPSGVIPA